MNQVQELENLKAVKRSAKFSYQFLRTYYIDKYNLSSNEEREIYANAITALDEMYKLYESLKFRMRKKSVSEQIEFVEKWEAYILCIEKAITYKINEEKIGENSDLTYSLKKAISLYSSFKSLSAQ